MRVNALPVDIKVNHKVEVRKVATDREIELLISTVSYLVLTKGVLPSWKPLTFPASLATNAVIVFGPSCLTSYVSSSIPSHMIAKFKDCRIKGMVQV
jgi:hypothetical protein